MGIRKGIRIGNARDGKKFAFIEDIESTMPDHSAEGVDVHGNVYGAVVRRSDVRAQTEIRIIMAWLRGRGVSPRHVWGFEEAIAGNILRSRNTHGDVHPRIEKSWRAGHYQRQGRGKPMVADLWRQFDSALGR